MDDFCHSVELLNFLTCPMWCADGWVLPQCWHLSVSFAGRQLLSWCKIIELSGSSFCCADRWLLPQTMWNYWTLRLVNCVVQMDGFCWHSMELLNFQACCLCCADGWLLLAQCELSGLSSVLRRWMASVGTVWTFRLVICVVQVLDSVRVLKFYADHLCHADGWLLPEWGLIELAGLSWFCVMQMDDYCHSVGLLSCANRAAHKHMDNLINTLGKLNFLPHSIQDYFNLMYMHHNKWIEQYLSWWICWFSRILGSNSTHNIQQILPNRTSLWIRNSENSWNLV